MASDSTPSEAPRPSGASPWLELAQLSALLRVLVADRCTASRRRIGISPSWGSVRKCLVLRPVWRRPCPSWGGSPDRRQEFTVLETHVGVEAQSRRRTRGGLSRHRRRRLLPDRPPSQVAGRGYLRHRGLSISDPIGRLLHPASREPAGGRQVSGSHPCHQWLLPASPRGMERRRGGRCPGRILPQPSGEPPERTQQPSRTCCFQRTLVSMGVELHWPAAIQTIVR